MRISVAKKKTSKRWRSVDLSWDEFVRRIQTPFRTPETTREYRCMSRDDRDTAKGALGGFVGGVLSSGQRKTEFVTERTLITLDADNAAEGAWDNASMFFENRMLCYSTHSHTEESPRLRWVIPTDRPMTPDEYPAVARKVATWLDIESMDPTTYEVARLMYWPTCSSDGIYEFHSQEGPVLRVDDVLALYGPGDAWKDTTLWPIAKAEQEVRAHVIRRAGEPTTKPGVVGLFCRNYDVPAAISEFLPDVYEETAVEGRYTYTKGSTSGGAIVYNDGAFLYSNHATDPAGGGQCCNAFDLVRIHKFGDLDSDTPDDTAINHRPSYAAMCEWASSLPEIKIAAVDEKSAALEEEFGDLVGGAAEEQADEPDDSWKTKITRNSKTMECEPTIENARLILMNDPAIKGKFGFDEFQSEPRYFAGLPWRKGESVHEGETGLWTDYDEAEIRRYLQMHYSFKSENDLKNALEIAMKRNAFHPVREYLESLEWDGKPRVDTVLIRTMGAQDTPLNRAMTSKWMIGAVHRIMVPGCKFDQILVLLGEQGLGKSTFGSILAKDKWFSDTAVRMDSKEGYDTLQGTWIQELGELASIKRSDEEVVKNFTTKKRDKYRKAYARRVEEYKRQCVFLGTTNEPEFLRDRSGSRRYWPIRVTHSLDFKGLEQEVDQLWAEAVARYKSGEKDFITDRAILDDLSVAHEEFQAEDELQTSIQNYLDMRLPENWFEMSPESRRDMVQGDDVADTESYHLVRGRVSPVEIRTELLGQDRLRGATDAKVSRSIVNVLCHLRGWEKIGRQKVPGYGVQICFQRIVPGETDPEFRTPRLLEAGVNDDWMD